MHDSLRLYKEPSHTESQKDSYETLAKLKQIFNQQPIVSYRKEKSLKDILVRAKLPSMKQQSQNQ